MWKESFVRELGLWVGTFGDVNLLYDDIIRDLWLKPKRITDNIILLRDLGIGKIYDFYAESPSKYEYHKKLFPV
jgi:hypothetical protein